MRQITNASIGEYEKYLKECEKATATIEKYVHDVTLFMDWAGPAEITKDSVIRYKQTLIKRYAVASVNSAISSLNHFFEWAQWYDLKVRTLKMQRRTYCSNEKELTKEEYEKLLNTAIDYGQTRLFLLLQTVCSTGIRISELEFITYQSLMLEKAQVRNKGKIREVLLPHELCGMLIDYCDNAKIKSGPIFVSRNGKPLNRSNIWMEMKKLCRKAGVAESKVFPHNLRHLFARAYYDKEKDIVRLADILGHSNINTTRTYTIENEEEHRAQIQNLGLLSKKSTT